jgi:signal peptidase II
VTDPTQPTPDSSDSSLSPAVAQGSEPTAAPEGSGVPGPTAAPEAAGASPSATPAAEPVPAPRARVEGDRLGTPVGAAHSVADYGRANPSYLFLFVVSVVSLAADIGSKTWAEKHLEAYPGVYDVWHDHLSLVLAKNRGGAWGLLQTTSESIRRPFFLLVSVAAILFIMTLYRRLQPRQTALRWGLPFVLGGALGNVFDRVRYGQVIDFIDAHARWGGQEHHWPTFNIADVCICVGVGLMAVDMFSSKRGSGPLHAPRVPPAQSGEPVPEWYPPPGASAAGGTGSATGASDGPSSVTGVVHDSQPPRS